METFGEPLMIARCVVCGRNVNMKRKHKCKDGKYKYPQTWQDVQRGD